MINASDSDFVSLSVLFLEKYIIYDIIFIKFRGNKLYE